MQVKTIKTILPKGLESAKKISTEKIAKELGEKFSETGKLTSSLDGLAIQGMTKVTSNLTPDVASKIQKLTK